ncbi:hypothetical protein WJX72_005117 [[Myrmecia] bisecta]|uniref:RRM domain-containing protein n=1 Tax=[Myrmecia] bisecta TaxID=41462 RepID=A0AAW1QEZ9_9CHLO
MAAPSYPSYPADPNAQYAQAYAPAPAQAAPADPYQQTYDPYAHHHHAAYAPVPAYAPYGHADELRTVFVTGFPADVKERELNNLLRFLPGYEASQMHWKNGQAQGFALFQAGAAARSALDSIHNLVFDEGVVLRCELAHKNMYIKDDPAVKRGRHEYNGYPAPAAAGAYAAPGAPAAAASYYPPAAAAAPAGPRGYAPVSNTKDNPPCNTLFIGNLGDTVSEVELRGIFSVLPGFRQLKLNRGAKSVTCFVEFSDVASAMAVHQSQQGAVLSSSDRGGMRIQYSKNPFGKKRDFGGNFTGPPGGDAWSVPSYSAPSTVAAPAAIPAAAAAEEAPPGTGAPAAVADPANGAAHEPVEQPPQA